MTCPCSSPKASSTFASRRSATLRARSTNALSSSRAARSNSALTNSACGAGLLAVEDPRADLDRVGDEPRGGLAGLARARGRAGRRSASSTTSPSTSSASPAARTVGGTAEGRGGGGFHGVRSHGTDAADDGTARRARPAPRRLRSAHGRARRTALADAGRVAAPRERRRLRWLLAASCGAGPRAGGSGAAATSAPVTVAVAAAAGRPGRAAGAPRRPPADARAARRPRAANERELRCWPRRSSARSSRPDAGRAGRRLAGEARGPCASRPPATDAELAALAFEEQVAARRPPARPGRRAARPRARRRRRPARADRRRATRCAVAEAIAAARRPPRRPARGRGARGRGARAARRGAAAASARTRTPIPARRVARRILQRLDGMGKWGGYHTEFAHLARGFAGNDRALAEEVGEALLDAGPAGREAVGRPAPRVPQPAAGRRHPRAHRERRAARGAAAAATTVRIRRARVDCGRRPTQPQAADAETLVGGGHRPADAARQARCAPRYALHRWGPTPAAGYTTSADPPPRRDGDHRRARARSPSARSTSAPTRSPTRSPTRGLGEGDGVAIMCRNHRGFIEATRRRARSSAPTRCTSTRRSPAPQIDGRRASARSPKAIVYDEEFAELSADAGVGRKRYIAWHEAARRAPATRCSRT